MSRANPLLNTQKPQFKHVLTERGYKFPQCMIQKKHKPINLYKF